MRNARGQLSGVPSARRWRRPRRVTKPCRSSTGTWPS